MKEEILCPHCAGRNRKPKLLGRYEDVEGRGVLYLYCKRCGEEIAVDLRTLSPDRRGRLATGKGSIEK